jgi:hypothetical protein
MLAGFSAQVSKPVVRLFTEGWTHALSLMKTLKFIQLVGKVNSFAAMNLKEASTFLGQQESICFILYLISFCLSIYLLI